MNQLRASQATSAIPTLPTFDGFPYLAIRLGPAFHHLLVLPHYWSIDDLKTLARCQAQANDFRVCLALSHTHGIYCEPDGRDSESSVVPGGGIVTCGILKYPVSLNANAELAERERSLQDYVATHMPNGCVFGDLTKGGRDANPEEARKLAGVQSTGVPNGLKKCERCGDWRGQCLDPNPHFNCKVMRVYCLCENHNACALCGQPLYERKLDANYYSEADSCIWHVPGFLALKHRCEGGGQWKA